MTFRGGDSPAAPLDLSAYRGYCRWMHLYLPIAGLSVNAFVIVMLGCGVGMLSGMFGVGGGFLTTPLLIFYGIPPSIAVASSATQITGASVSGVLAHHRRGGVDYRMGGVLVAGGAIGALIGAAIFRILRRSGHFDTVLGFLYVILLGWIGGTMARESLKTMWASRGGRTPLPLLRRRKAIIAALPMRWRFPGAGLYISPLAPFALGMVSGMLTVLMGISGGFILVPALIYLFGASARIVVGTSLFQALFVTAATTLVQATANHAVDIVLASLLLLGSVIGAQVGALLVQRIRPDKARLILAVIVLAIAIRMGAGLTWTPGELYSVESL